MELSPGIKTGIKIGVITAGVILLFEVSNLFLVYKYFKFDYYLSVVAIVFLATGIILSRWRILKVQPEISLPQNLTNKELVILQMIIEGKSNKEIAAANFVEVSTIKTHINNLYAKLEVSNRREVVNKYKRVVSGE